MTAKTLLDETEQAGRSPTKKWERSLNSGGTTLDQIISMDS